MVHTNLGGGIAHINKARSQAHRSPRRGETGGISTGIYRKGYPTSFSSGVFLLKFLGLRFTQPGVDRRAAVFFEAVLIFFEIFELGGNFLRHVSFMRDSG